MALHSYLLLIGIRLPTAFSNTNANSLLGVLSAGTSPERICCHASDDFLEREKMKPMIYAIEMKMRFKEACQSASMTVG